MKERIDSTKEEYLLMIQDDYFSNCCQSSKAQHYDLLAINFESFINSSAPITEKKAEIIRRFLKELIVDLPANLNDILKLTLIPDQKKYQVYNSINVCLLSLLIGRGLNYSHEDLLELGFAALMHDIGMFAMEGLIYTNEIFTKEQREDIKQHPSNGVRILDQFTKVTKDLELAILQEHEREDGSGYPKGINGKHIHQFAKIIAIADCFEALTHYRPYRSRSITPYQAAQAILQLSKSQLDTSLTNSLINALSFYPLGTFVRMAQGEIGMVVEINEDAPLSPVISLFYDREGQELQDKKRLNLQTEKDNHIAWVIDLKTPRA